MSVYSERAILGAMMTSPQTVDNLPDLQPVHFSNHEFGQLFLVIRNAVFEQEPSDVISIHQRIENTDLGYSISFSLLNDLMMDFSSQENLPKHFAIVFDAYRNRVTKQVCLHALQAIQAGGKADDVLNQIQAGLLDNASVSRAGPVELIKVLNEHTTVMEKRLDGQVKRLSFGLTDLDEKTGGMSAGDLVIVAARPSMGKSALSLGIAEQADGAVLVVNMEMANEQTADRLIARAGSIPLGWLRSPEGESDEGQHNWERYSMAIHKIQNKRIYLDDCPDQSLFSIRSSARQVQRIAGNLSCIIIDYLSLMGGSEAKERHNQVGEFSRGLKKLAKELQIPIVALAQLSRKCEERHDKRPMMSDLRESGQIEQDADTIIFIYRDEVYNRDSKDRGTAELIVSKIRQGSPGVVRVAFNGQYTRFDDLAPGWQAQEEQPRRTSSLGRLGFAV